jgi:hypothetical protein
MLEDNEKIPVGGVKSVLWRHRDTSSEDENSEARFGCRAPHTAELFQGMRPVHLVIEIEGIPSELLWDLMDFCRGIISVVLFERQVGR